MMKQKNLLMLAAMMLVGMCVTTMNAQTVVKGDMNDDGELNVSDVTMTVSTILGNIPLQTISLSGNPFEVDNTLVVGTWMTNNNSITFGEDGTTDLEGADTYAYQPFLGRIVFYKSGVPVTLWTVVAISAEVLSVNPLGAALIQNYTQGVVEEEQHDYVDLGLPSGTLWATCNIGAENPEDYGDYFAWGETEPQADNAYSWSSYKYAIDSRNTLTKYCNDSSFGNNGFTDNLTELEFSDDAAVVNWGQAWRMPSKEQFDELINSSYTTIEEATLNGVWGRKITSNRNGNSIFLPAAGSRHDSSLYVVGSCGYFWSRTLDSDYPFLAWGLFFNSSNVFTGSYNRCNGYSVRPVRLSE